MVAAFHKPVVCPVLIGRVSELATLHALIDQAKSGRGQVVLLGGEAGVGKSRLVTKTKAYAMAQDFLMLQGNCFSTDRSSPYAPLLDLVRSTAARQLAATFATDLAPFARELHQLLPEIVPLPSNLAPLSSGDPEQEKQRLFTALAQFFIGQATKQPLLLIIEDIHWSDDTSLEFLHYLARRCPAYPLLLLLTYRSDEVHPRLRHFLAQLDRERLTQEILLTRLVRDEVEAMLRAIFALPRSARLELPELMYTLTEGNPFFVEEVLKSLIAAGEIFYANGRWERKPLSELHIPRSVQDAVQQRTDQLSESARHVLTLAAVAGRRFDFVLLQQLTHYDEQQLLVLMKELIAAQLVVEESAERFAFRHALTRQAIYADLLVRERKALHRTIADTMERLYAPETFEQRGRVRTKGYLSPYYLSPGQGEGSRKGPHTDSQERELEGTRKGPHIHTQPPLPLHEAHLTDLAYHYYEAGAWEKAMEYGQRAGEQAHNLYAPQAAIEQVTRALEAAQRGSIPPPASLYRLRGRAYETLGDFERARLDYETTLQMARSAGNRHDEWQALLDLGELWKERDYSQTGAYYQQALELARRMDEPLTLAYSLTRLGNWHLNIEEPHEALDYQLEALTLFQQAQDQHGLAETYDLLGMTTALEGDLLQASAYYQQAIALFQQLGDRQGLASSLPTLMVLGQGGGYETETMVSATTSFAESLHFGKQALKIAREIGSRSAEVYALFMLAHYLGPHGEYAQALEVAQASLALAEQIEHHEWVVGARWQLGTLYLDLLALPEGRQQLEQALALAHEIGSWIWIRIVSGFLAPVYLRQQDLANADSILSAGLEPDAAMQTIGQRLVWAARADLALTRGEPDQALNITDQLIGSAANMSEGQVIPRLWKLRGEALAALHRPAEAETMLLAAQAAAHAQGLRGWLWRICAVLGRLYQAQGRREEAEQAFSTARVLIEELAANLPDEHVREQFLTQATAMLPQKRSLTPARAAKEAFGGLTAREREVATMITQGKSNREIAEMLVVSERTVESHVANIMFKLGVQSRRQIRAWAIEKGL